MRQQSRSNEASGRRKLATWLFYAYLACMISLLIKITSSNGPPLPREAMAMVPGAGLLFPFALEFIFSGFKSDIKVKKFSEWATGLSLLAIASA